MRVQFEDIFKKINESQNLVEPTEGLVQEWTDYYLKKFKEWGYNDNGWNSKLARYFAKYAICNVHRTETHRPFRKGLFLAGTTGTGKTLIMEIFSELFEVKMMHVETIAKDYAKFGEEVWEWIDPKLQSGIGFQGLQNGLILDDIGTERDAGHYGNKGFIPALLGVRYERFIQSGKLTHFTANLSTEEIKQHYGERIWSRFNEMCVFVSMTGKDMRMPSTAKASS